MRGHIDPHSHLFSYFSPEERVPAGHPLRLIKAYTESALKRIRPLLDGLYSEIGRPSIPPERLLKAQLLIALYSVLSVAAVAALTAEIGIETEVFAFPKAETRLRKIKTARVISRRAAARKARSRAERPTTNRVLRVLRAARIRNPLILQRQRRGTMPNTKANTHKFDGLIAKQAQRNWRETASFIRLML
jgi:hypothetical protein